MFKEMWGMATCMGEQKAICYKQLRVEHTCFLITKIYEPIYCHLLVSMPDTRWRRWLKRGGFDSRWGH